MAKERKTFRDIFEENSKEELALLFDVEVKGEKFKKGHKFTASDDLAGVNFHKYRYLDLAVEQDPENGVLKLLGFYPAQK